MDPNVLKRSRMKSLCPWKGLAHYYTVTVDGEVNPNAAWYYPHPSPLARRIKDHVAFWNGVTIEGQPEGDRQGWTQRVAAWLGARMTRSDGRS